MTEKEFQIRPSKSKPGFTTMPHTTYNEKIDTLVFEIETIVLFKRQTNKQKQQTAV